MRREESPSGGPYVVLGTGTIGRNPIGRADGTDRDPTRRGGSYSRIGIAIDIGPSGVRKSIQGRRVQREAEARQGLGSQSADQYHVDHQKEPSYFFHNLLF